MQTHIWYVTAADPGMSNFYVDANPKISISILAAGAKSWIGTRKINDFEVNCTLIRKKISAPAAGCGACGAGAQNVKL